MQVRTFQMLTLLLRVAAGASAGDFKAEITLEPLDSDRWQVEYELSTPVPALVLARGQGDYRKSTWTLDRGFVLDRLGATDRLRRVDGEAFDRLRAKLASHSEPIQKDYTPCIRFTDGAVAVSTGQFIGGIPESDWEEDFVEGTGMAA